MTVKEECHLPKYQSRLSKWLDIFQMQGRTSIQELAGSTHPATHLSALQTLQTYMTSCPWVVSVPQHLCLACHICWGCKLVGLCYQTVQVRQEWFSHIHWTGHLFLYTPSSNSSLKFKPSRICFKVRYVVKPAFSLLLAFFHQLPLLLLKLPPKHLVFSCFLILQAGILKPLNPGTHHCLQVFFQPAPLSSQRLLFPGESQIPPASPLQMPPEQSSLFQSLSKLSPAGFPIPTWPGYNTSWNWSSSCLWNFWRSATSLCSTISRRWINNAQE